MSNQYDGYKVFRYIPGSREDMNALLDLAEERNEGVIFLTQVSDIGQPVDVMVLPALQDKLIEAMKKRGVEASVIVENTAKSGKQIRRNSLPHDANSQAQLRLNNMNNNGIDVFERVSDIMGYNIQRPENVKINATIGNFQFLVGSEKLEKHKVPIYLTDKMTVPNHSCSDITANFVYSKQLKQSFSFSFDESLSFVSSAKISGCRVPLKHADQALNFSVTEGNIFLAPGDDNINVAHSCESIFAVNNSVSIPPYKCVEIHVYVNWLRQLEIPFTAEITLTAGGNGGLTNAKSNKSLAFVEQALRACNFNGKILKATPDGDGLIIFVRGTFKGNYALGTVFSVQDTLDPLMVVEGQDQESGFKHNRIYQIVNAADKRALELFAGDKNDSAKVVTLDKNHRETQHWKAITKGNGFQLTSVIQDDKAIKVLTNDSQLNKVKHSYHNEGDLLQKWITQKIGSDEYLIICCANQKCLTSQGNGLSVTTEAIRGPEICQLWKILEC